VLDQIEARAATGRLSVYLGSVEAQNKGIGTTAIYRSLEYAFQIERTLRWALVVNARWLDAFYMGLFAQDFLSWRAV
jgi:hypothetical protein